VRPGVAIRALENPRQFGLLGKSLYHYRQWVLGKRQQFLKRAQTYGTFLAQGGSAEGYAQRQGGGQFQIFSHILALLADRYGAGVLEQTLRAFHQDGLPKGIYKSADSPVKKNTLFICIVSCSAQEDLQAFFHSWGFATDAAYFNQIRPTVTATLKEIIREEYVDGWIRWPGNGHLYRLVPWKTKWEQANRLAQRLGGHLVDIESAGEEDWLLKRYTHLEAFWLGLTADSASGAWRWTSNAPLTYTNWASNQPIQDNTPRSPAIEPKRRRTWSNLRKNRNCTVIVERQ
jgi:hypothetical protein